MSAPSATTAKAWQLAEYGSPSGLKLTTVNLPALKPGEALLKVLATDSTYTDLLILQGSYQPRFPVPVVPGYCAIAIVEAVSAPAGEVAVGDTVAVMPQHGCAQTRIIVPAAKCVKIRPDAAPERAVALVLTGVTAYQMLHRSTGGRLANLSTRTPATMPYILVHGCTGGTGAMLVELAKVAGLPGDHIFGTCSGRNVETARQMGIRPIDYSAGGGDWDTQVRAGTAGRGVDVVFDAVLMNGYYSKSLSCLARGGKLVAYGVTNTAAPGVISVPSIITVFLRMGLQSKLWSWFDGKEAQFYNIADRRAAHPQDFAEDVRSLMDLLASGTLSPFTGKVWPFDSVPQALQSIADNKHVGKQIIKVQA